MGPLEGLKIIEMSGVGPAPFAAMMLADNGADIIRVCRPGTATDGHAPGLDAGSDILFRSRPAIEIDIRTSEGAAAIREIAATADGLIEGFRPGVMERLGLGPDALLALNPGLVYGRMTGWGQTGPLSQAAGHDINYIALTGALHACGPAGGKPVVPLNLIGDFGGGGMMLAFGMVSALYHARSTGTGQVIDCAMTDGSAALMAMTWSLFNGGQWIDRRGSNVLDGGAHFYDSFETSDGKYIALGSIEPKFYAAMLHAFGLAEDAEFNAQYDRAGWPALREKIARVVRTRSRDQWCNLLEGTDLCFAPVLSLEEAPEHPHNVARQTFIRSEAGVAPAPGPRYSATPLSTPQPAAGLMSGSDVIETWGHEGGKLDALVNPRAIR